MISSESSARCDMAIGAMMPAAAMFLYQGVTQTSAVPAIASGRIPMVMATQNTGSVSTSRSRCMAVTGKLVVSPAKPNGRSWFLTSERTSLVPP